MGIDRRGFIGAAAIAGAGAMLAENAGAAAPIRRIATEEAFATREQMAAMIALGHSDWDSPDLSLWRSFGGANAARSRLRAGLLDLDMRLADMDANDVAMHILSLTSPGVQMFDADTATGIAQSANDELAETIARHPGRFAGLAAFAPQDPARAAKEMERAVHKLGLNGFILNSHTNDHYFDDRKFWPILEAAEALDRPIYIHPRCPSAPMYAACADYGLASGMWGFHVETSLHATRMILGGCFDQFPKLRIVLGHMGEGLPYWLYRIDHVYQALNPPGSARRIKTLPRETFARNFVITTSGVNDEQVLAFTIAQLGLDKVLWAIDYPYEQSAPAVAFMDKVAVTPAQRRALYQTNAERVFHLA